MKFKKLAKESYIAPDKDKAIASYRTFAQLDENFEITAENLNEWALNEAAVKSGIQKADLRHMILGEDISLDAAARQMEAEKEIVRTKSDIEEALDDTLHTAKRKHRAGSRSNYPTLLIEGEAGIGKTAIVRSWCSENNLSFFSYDIRQASPESFEGVVASDPKNAQFVMRKISRELLIPLSRPNCVMFIDEFNRGGPGIRAKLMDLILNHRMQVPFISDDFDESKEFYAQYGDLEEDGNLYFTNLLFVVCAQNPYSDRYSGTYELDSADVDRMQILHPEVNYESVLQYITKKCNQEIKQLEAENDAEGIKELKGQLAIATKLLRSPDFAFDSTEERERIYNKYGNTGKCLTPRSLEFALEGCNGTKESFLRLWKSYCNIDKLEMATNILSDYVDAEDEATAAVQSETESPLFSTKQRVSTRLQQALGL